MASDLALTKYLHPLDRESLEDELATVDQHFTRRREQHSMRRWEYAMALHALQQWTPVGPRAPFADVGGAGSPFADMLGLDRTHVIDPDDGGLTLAQYMRTTCRTFPAVFCLSVIEHIPIEALDRFCYHLSCLTAPGGLLMLTCDAVGVGGAFDTYHFRWMREQIFDRSKLVQLLDVFARYQCQPLGRIDLTYPGPQVYDYSFAALTLQKRS